MMVVNGDTGGGMRALMRVSLSSMFAMPGLACFAGGGDLSAKKPSESAQCDSIGLSACPQPFDAVLPPAETLLSWDQSSRVIGFRNTYRLYQGDVFRTLAGKAYPLHAAPYPLPA